MIPHNSYLVRFLETILKAKRPMVAAALGFGVFFTPYSAASADGLSDCSVQVVDTSGQVDVAAVEDAIDNELVDLDTSLIYVRAYGGLEPGELAAEADDFLAACQTRNWIAVQVSVDGRETEVDAALLSSQVVDEISVSTMSPRFADGNFTDGLIEGVEALAEEQRQILVDNDNPVASEQTETSDSSAGGALGGVALGGTALVLAGGAGTTVVVKRRRELAARREEFAARVVNPQTRAGTAERRYTHLLKQVEVWRQLSAGSTLKELERSKQAADRAHQEVRQNLTLLDKATPEGVENASADELDRAGGYLDQMETSIANQDSSLDGLLSVGAKIDHLRIALPAKRDLLLEEVAAAVAISEDLASKDWDVTEEKSKLAGLVSDLETVSADDLIADFFELHERQETAEAVLFSVAHSLQSLPNRADSLRKWRDQLDASYEMELTRIDNSRQRLAELENIHSEESWSWALEHPDKALGYLESAVTLLRVVTIENASSSEFDEAGRTLEAAGLELLAADDLLDQIDDLLVDLDRARIESPGIIEQSKSVLESFAQFVAEHEENLTPELIGSPPQHRATITELEHELGMARPNYLRVAQTGDRINREIDALMIEAQDTQRKNEALRRATDREVARAQRSLQRARASMGWQIFDSPDSEALDQLADRLRTIPSEPAAGLAAATRIADSAVAIQERIIARRRRNADWVIVSGGSSWSGGGWSNGSGWSGGSSGGGVGGGSFGGSIGGGSFGGGHSSQSW